MSCLEQPYSRDGWIPVWTYLDSPILDKVANFVADVSTNLTQPRLPNLNSTSLGIGMSPVSVPLRAPDQPNVRVPNVDTPQVPSLQNATYSALRSIIDFTHSSPLVPPITYAQGLHHLSLPNVNLSAPPLNYPIADTLAVAAPPTLPSIAKPDIALGSKPVLNQISQIRFSPVTLSPLPFPSDLNAIADEISNADLIVNFVPQKTYTRDAAAIAKLRDLMRGQDEVAQWLSSQVILFAADSRKIPVEAKQAIDKVFEQIAARNFALPNGIADAQIAAIAYAELEQKQQLIEKIEAEVVDAALSAVLAAVQSAIDLEKYHAALFMQYIRGNLSLYKLNVAGAISVYNTLVRVLDLYGNFVSQHVDNYNQYVSAVLEQNKASAADASLLLAKVATFEAQAKIHRTDAETLKNIADVESINVRVQTLPLQAYRAHLDGLLANYSILETNLRSYAQAIENYTKHFQLIESEVNAFEAAVRAENSFNAVNEANVRAYAAAWQAERQRVGAYENYVRSSLSVLEAEMDNFRAAMSAERSYLSGVSEYLQAALQSMRSYLDIARNQISLYNSYNRANLDYTKAYDRLRIIEEEFRLEAQTLGASQTVQTARLQSALDEIKIRVGGALSQAASMIYSVGVGATGTAGISGSGTYTTARNYDFSNRYTFARSCREEVRPLRR